MSIKIIVSCETFGCHATMNFHSYTTKKNIRETLKQYKWLTVTNKKNLPKESHHCQGCVRENRV